MFSGLSIDDFLRRTHMISYTKKALERVKEPLKHLTAIEGLPRHYDPIKVRLS